MSELINRWFGRAGRLPGVVAYGLRYPDATVFSNTWEARLSQTVLNELWSRLAPMAGVAAPGETHEMLRWTFNGGVVIGTARTDGPAFFVLASKKVDELDMTGVQRLLSEFRALRG
ncbi:MAG TPA: hypothetical protein VK846_08555 [Candidatus Limnocylindria bacterium]|nr:hypothetical protein [Candidatus Limnocylindria bacterium]